MTKRMLVFAGPNGSGKSTVINTAIELGQCPGRYICPDNLVAPENKEIKEAYEAAMRDAEGARYSEIAQGNSFTFETVLSTPSKLEFIRYAKMQGYLVHVVYVTTENPGINMKRVKVRVEHGGHDVPVDKILSRYEKSMALMFDVVCEAHSADIYDNSGDTPRLVAAMINGCICVAAGHPDWVETRLLSKAREKGVTIGTIR
jgi:predicted ABC-type ATPase